MAEPRLSEPSSGHRQAEREAASLYVSAMALASLVERVRTLTMRDIYGRQIDKDTPSADTVRHLILELLGQIHGGAVAVSLNSSVKASPWGKPLIGD